MGAARGARAPASGDRKQSASTEPSAELGPLALTRPRVVVTRGAVTYDPNSDYYVLLGLPDTASHAEIRAAYRARIQHAHPDKSTGDGAMAAALNVAWDVLGDAKKRAAYDDARRRYLANVAADAAAAKARAARRARKVRARAAAPAAPKAARKAPAITRAAAPSSPRVVDVAVDNLMQSLRNKEYGKALGWFLLGMALDDAQRPPARPRARRRRRR